MRENDVDIYLREREMERFVSVSGEAEAPLSKNSAESAASAPKILGPQVVFFLFLVDQALSA